MKLQTQSLAQQKVLVQALTGVPTSRIPFWLMRQAGRYLPEYRQLRQQAGSFLNLCFNPEWAAEVTLQPLRRFDMDAAILFSDILVIPHALGQTVTFAEGEGPRLEAFDAQRFNEINLDMFDERTEPVYQAIQRIMRQLSPEKALIGFAGAPWTVACYMVQGRGGDEFLTTKKYAFTNSAAFDQLIETLVSATSRYLIHQIKNGVDAVQIFDSWAGLLPSSYFDRWIIEPTRKIVANIHKAYPGFPVIGFPRGAGPLYKRYAQYTGVSCVGIDQYYSMTEAVDMLSQHVALQGNLDPVLLLTGGKALEAEVRRILRAAEKAPFIFNLGHGIIKETPPEHVAQLADIVKAYQR